MAVATEVAVAVGLQLLVAALHRQERRLVELEQPRRARRLVELEQHRQARRLVVLVPRRQQAAALDRRQLAAGAAGVISPAAQTRTAPLILDSPKWLAIPTACRR